jgi:hypothetical protein
MRFELRHTTENNHVTKYVAVFEAESLEDAKQKAKRWIENCTSPGERKGYTLVPTEHRPGWWMTLKDELSALKSAPTPDKEQTERKGALERELHGYLGV